MALTLRYRAVLHWGQYLKSIGWLSHNQSVQTFTGGQFRTSANSSRGYRVGSILDLDRSDLEVVDGRWWSTCTGTAVRPVIDRMRSYMNLIAFLLLGFMWSVIGYRVLGGLDPRTPLYEDWEEGQTVRVLPSADTYADEDARQRRLIRAVHARRMERSHRRPGPRGGE